MFHAQIAQRAFNTPLLVEPAKAMAFLAGLGARIAGRRVEFAGLDVPEAEAERAALPAQAGVLVNDLAEQEFRMGGAPYAVRDGVAIIQVSGVLIHRGSWIGQSSGQTSYEGLASQIEAAAKDPTVLGIALELDSFGGEVAGAFDLADRLRAARARKPVWAFVAEHAFSAAYALASQADRIILPRTGRVGSIGVLVMHADLSGMMEQDGVTVTLIHSGARKVDGNPYEPLPTNVRETIQAEIDATRLLFAQTVAAGRGSHLTEAAALATEAASFRGDEAVAAGLADEVSDLGGAFARFTAEVNRRRTAPGPAQGRTSQARKEKTMDNDQQQPAHENASSEQQPSVAASSQASEAATRAECAEIAQIAAQAARMGVTVDAADAMAKGLKPDALRRSVLDQAAAASQATVVVQHHAPAADQQTPRASSLLAKAKAAAEQQRLAN